MRVPCVGPYSAAVALLLSWVQIDDTRDCCQITFGFFYWTRTALVISFSFDKYATKDVLRVLRCILASAWEPPEW